MQSVWKKTGKCRKICKWAINAGSIAMPMMIVCHKYYHYDRIDLRVDVMFCRLSLTLFQVMQQLLHV